jgi:prephenate dehydratase|tara:strand:+ start:407 stop:619 length:213 start_codon:yes stop_codon:yes gene_type:complete
MISKENLQERLVILEEDIVKVQQNLKTLEQQKTEALGMLNALTGAKQQCQSFLNELNNDEPEASDSSDVE